MFIFEGLSTQYINTSRKINNFVGAVEAATDIKKENLAIERKLAVSSSATDLVMQEESHQQRNCFLNYLKIAIPWLIFLVFMSLIAYFIIISSLG